LVVLAFLATAFLLAVAAVVLLYALIARRRTLAFASAAGAGVLLLSYGVALLTASAMSRERVLQHGDLKYFCEIDCHLAYSVMKVETTSEIGDPPRTVHAAGVFYVVALRAWFDPTSISPRRPLDVPLTPNPRVVRVQDAAGRRYGPSAEALRALISMGRISTPLTQPLKPGESYVSYLVFDLPKDARNPRLFLGSATDVEFLLIGHEMSPWHKKVWFSLF
jgi:hypothetical protein